MSFQAWPLPRVGRWSRRLGVSSLFQQQRGFLEKGVHATMIGIKPEGRLADIGKIIDEGKLRPSFKRFFHSRKPNSRWNAVVAGTPRERSS